MKKDLQIYVEKFQFRFLIADVYIGVDVDIGVGVCVDVGVCVGVGVGVVVSIADWNRRPV
jgi:hypothetical protein